MVKRNNHNAAQGPQHFTSSVVSKNQNQGLFDDYKTECDESTNDDSKEVFQDRSIFENSNLGDILDIVGAADKQIPQPSFVFDKPKKIRSLVFEDNMIVQIKMTMMKRISSDLLPLFSL